jgi:hypothetical protein
MDAVWEARSVLGISILSNILYDLNKDNRTVSGLLGGGETTLYTKV